MKVSYQDPCHLAHAQGIRRQPRQLIRAIPGIELVESAHSDACCGSAGLYSTLEPEMSGKVLDMKLDDVLEAAPQVVITANPGCQMQLQSGLRKRGRDTKVMHLAELLMLAYG
jgi:glycolate oxidase iron-sulfur subunit